MESFGEYLKRERQLRNISLGEVSKVTRINKSLLQAIEADKFDLLPSKAFVKGFLRSYCRIVGLDPEEVILRFESTLEPKPVVPPSGVKPHASHYFRIVYVLPVAFVIILAGLILMIHRKGETPSSQRTESTRQEGTGQMHSASPQTLPERGTAMEAPSDSQGPGLVRQISVPGPKGLELKATASKETWIMIRADDGEAVEATLRADEEYVWRARRKMSLRVGNAGGVSLTVNDKPLGILGPEGRVVGLVFTAP